MALTRKLLSAMGIAEEQATEIINAHTETVNGLKAERDGFKVDAEKLPEVQKELNKTKEKLKAYEESADESPWKTKYDDLVKEKDDLKKEYDDYKAGVTAKELLSKKRSAYKKLLKEAGVSEKRFDTILKVTDLKDVDFEEDSDKLKDESKLIDSIKSEWADFIGIESTQGANVPKPQGTDGTGNLQKPPVARPISRAAQIAAQYHAEHYGSKEA